MKLIYIHIPKTGGRSMFRVLKSVYSDQVAGPVNKGKYFNHQPSPQSLIGIIPPGKTVLYSHLLYKHVRDMEECYSPKIITWMRQPVERLISAYYFQLNKYTKDPGNSNLRVDSNTSLMDFAKNPVNQNVQNKFLEGIALSKLFFIGFLDFHNQDLNTLARLLHWDHYPDNVWVNKNSIGEQKITKSPITPSMYKQIAKWNQEDVALYQEALAMRPHFQKKSLSFGNSTSNF